MSGRFIISLDFELHWGMYDHLPVNDDVRDFFSRTQALIPLLLERFEKRDIRATWATVGALFARNRDEMLRFLPDARPNYREPRFDARRKIISNEKLGEDEQDDPCHYAPSLIEEILNTPGQELASHTYAHLFSLEEGIRPEDLKLDLRAAQAISLETTGQKLRSLVFPRNQYSEELIGVLEESGIRTYRANPSSWFWSPRRKKYDFLHRRIVRYGDDYIPVSWSRPSVQTTVRNNSPVLGQSFSRFLRPPLHILDRLMLGEWLKLGRIKREMTRTARKGGAYHLWWHPHNMAISSDQSFAIIDAILDHFVHLRDRFGMKSRTMIEYAEETGG